MLEILTHLNKSERVSRKIDAANFSAVPGIWARVQADGSIAADADSEDGGIHKLVLTSASDNIYESHDVEVGRITTLETIGTRVKVDTEGYAGSKSLGDFLMVSTEADTKGKLVSTVGDEEAGETGAREIVARVEQVNTDGTIIYRTISPAVHPA
jgi:hypothetical protein